jgi:transcriptional regulator with XRE-family HTH domain
MLKNYLKEKKISIYQLSKETGISYSTLNNLVNQKTDAATCSGGVLRKIARYLNLTMDEVYDLCSYSKKIFLGGIEADLFVKDQSFFITFIYDGVKKTERIYSIKGSNFRYMEAVGYHELEKLSKKMEREKYVLYFNAQEQSSGTY